MAELIPRLRVLVDRPGDFEVPEKFVTGFVQLHQDDWSAAQSDWELVVAQVLDTDAIEPTANGRKAIRQAVTASYLLLEYFMGKGLCPLCQKRRRSK